MRATIHFLKHDDPWKEAWPWAMKLAIERYLKLSQRGFENGFYHQIWKENPKEQKEAPKGFF